MDEVDQTEAETNAKRAARAGAALDAYMALYSDPENALTDLLADLVHHAARTGQDFEDALETARGHDLAELDEDE